MNIINHLEAKELDFFQKIWWEPKIELKIKWMLDLISLDGLKKDVKWLIMLICFCWIYELVTVCYKTWYINIKGDYISMSSGQKNHLLQVQAIVTKICNEPDI